MSQTGTTPQAAVKLLTDLQNELFFSKLAGYGITPTTEAEATALLDMGQKLAAAHASLAPTNRFERFQSKLASDLNQLPATASTADAHYKQAEAALVQNLASAPDVQAAFLALQ